MLAPDLDDQTVEALGKLSEALEWVERSRGALYDFHQKIGHADLTLGDAIELFEKAGHTEQAELLRTTLLGRNVLPGRWTYQIMEEYDTGYWSVFRDVEQAARDALAGGRKHVFEARMKADERTRAGREVWADGA
ncbi:MAG TPA: hypothetical protein VHE83_01700 [Mycobacteriales bacterium]|nr:hypothetical protein [Mycobacteriales bacterium]